MPDDSLSVDRLYTITVILLDGQQHVVEFRRHAYNNLMELIVNELYENIGDCKGHAWCGTCHVEILTNETVAGETLTGEAVASEIQSGEILENAALNAPPIEPMTRDEVMTLGKLPNTVPSSRLACQIMVDELIDNAVFRVRGDVS
ncbi:ferredoxin, 2Fe-2S [Neorhodopirellula lusitana]|uniref:Ferredoxin, 2Fe-2S n=1 Tax=Neorhodopirellula lusitana TaxID=445327 RepID=A0ABY1Q6Y3_9BACT|nr:2Fe-2S iron-sulfur cluster-binding protein [Neorhodopirellula lusitana]SMP61616.1 ferredoxin, 2Fe-2S [Neorhodopirellula lusitana]